MCSRIPNRDTHEPRRSDAHDIAVSSSIGVASGCGNVRVAASERCWQKRIAAQYSRSGSYVS